MCVSGVTLISMCTIISIRHPSVYAVCLLWSFHILLSSHIKMQFIIGFCLPTVWVAQSHTLANDPFFVSLKVLKNESVDWTQKWKDTVVALKYDWNTKNMNFYFHAPTDYHGWPEQLLHFLSFIIMMVMLFYNILHVEMSCIIMILLCSREFKVQHYALSVVQSQ